MKGKILIAEDNTMVSKVIQKTLEHYNFETTVVENGKDAYEAIQAQPYDLIITDIEMPEMNGIELMKKLYESPEFKTPIMVLSAQGEDELVIESLSLGAEDYIIKPISTQVMLLRIYKVLGLNRKNIFDANQSKNIINKEKVGIVIPCYNEEKRIQTGDFKKFTSQNSSYQLCFVNDGSKDNTLALLENFQKENPERIYVYNCPQNMGKAEAVRSGVNFLLSKNKYDYIGFLDSDLSTDFSNFEALIDEMSNNQYEAVIGSRIQRIGATINKESSREIISKIINSIIKQTVGMPFQDTQCGAKLFTRETAEYAFKKPFVSRWLFDVEILMRIKNKLGTQTASKKILESPLKQWIHVDGSKLGLKDSFRIILELFKINYNKIYENFSKNN